MIADRLKIHSPVQLRVNDRSDQLTSLCPKFRTRLHRGLPTHRSNVLRYGLYRALRHAGLRRVDMHSLRHSFASALIMAGAPVTEVQYLLGHSSPQTTLKVYSHWFANTKSDSVHRLSRTLTGNFGHFLDTLDRSGGSTAIGRSGQVVDFTDETMAPPAGFEPTAPGLGISS